MIFRGLAAALAVLALVGVAVAQEFEPFTVKDIRVEGLQRTEPGTVFSYLPVKVGETMNAEKARAALRALYATGFFSDVRLEAEGGRIPDEGACCIEVRLSGRWRRQALQSSRDTVQKGGMPRVVSHCLLCLGFRGVGRISGR